MMEGIQHSEGQDRASATCQHRENMVPKGACPYSSHMVNQQCYLQLSNRLPGV